MSASLKGLTEMQSKLRMVAERFPYEVAKALYTEAEIEKTESMRRTPVDTGALRASHVVTRPTFQGRAILVDIAVGGPSASYAVYVHEDLTALHPHGQAKFLESTIMESAPFMAARIARRIDLAKLF